MRLITETNTRAHITARMSAWVGQRQQKLSDRVQATGDERARQHGWEVTDEHRAARLRCAQLPGSPFRSPPARLDWQSGS
jgi:hypothetical protein